MSWMKLIMAVLALTGTPAFSGAPDQYGLSPRGLATGNADMADADPVYAAFYNPAGVAEKGNRSGLQMTYVNLNLKDLNAGYQSGSDALLPTDTYRASEQEPLEALGFGLQTGLFPGVGFGIAGMVPREILNMRGLSGEEVQYLQYHHRQKKPEIYFALGLDLPFGFSLGMGAYFTLAARGQVQVGLSDESSRGRLQLSTDPKVIPYGGLAWQGKLFSGTMKVASFYRQGHRSTVEVDSEFVAKTDSFVLPTSIQSELSAFYDPALWRLGTSYLWSDYAVHLSYERSLWSRYRAPVLLLKGDDIATLTGSEGSGDRVDLSDAEALKFGTTMKHSWLPGGYVGLGVAQHFAAKSATTQSPVVDVDRQTFSVGFGGDVFDPLSESGDPMALSFGYQFSQLKDTSFVNAQGQRYVAGGQIHTLMVGGQRRF